MLPLYDGDDMSQLLTHTPLPKAFILGGGFSPAEQVGQIQVDLEVNKPLAH